MARLARSLDVDAPCGSTRPNRCLLPVQPRIIAWMWEMAIRMRVRTSAFASPAWRYVAAGICRGDGTPRP